MQTYVYWAPTPHWVCKWSGWLLSNFLCWLTEHFADLIIIVIIILFKYQHTMQCCQRQQLDVLVIFICQCQYLEILLAINLSIELYLNSHLWGGYSALIIFIHCYAVSHLQMSVVWPLSSSSLVNITLTTSPHDNILTQQITYHDAGIESMITSQDCIFQCWQICHC